VLSLVLLLVPAADPIVVKLAKHGAPDAAAFAVNDNDVITGWSNSQATHWKNGGDPIVDAQIGSESYEVAVNADGVTVVNSDATPDVVGGTLTFSVALLVAGELAPLPSLGVPGLDSGFAINDAGDVVGMSAPEGGDGTSAVPVVWLHGAGAAVALPRTTTARGYATAINNVGMVVGVEDDRVLEVWLDVTSDALPLVIEEGSGAEPDAINDDGVIVGDLSNGLRRSGSPCATVPAPSRRTTGRRCRWSRGRPAAARSRSTRAGSSPATLRSATRFTASFGARATVTPTRSSLSPRPAEPVRSLPT
jgi:hypothetical protein